MESFLNKIRFKEFSMTDYSAVKNLWYLSGLPTKDKGRDKDENVAKELDKGVAHFLLVEFNNQLIGVVLLTHDGRKGWINRLAIHPDYKRKGLARLLVNKSENYFHSIGIDIIACMIEDYNQTSLATFQKLGYIEFKGMHYLTKRKYPEV
jgi:ribosomal protein S18 acetylase RimI-like enzyme